MPDRRSHRGPHPEDARLFAPDVWPILRQAVDDLCWLLSRGYAGPSSLKLVGDRYGLVQRQRTAVGRTACSDDGADQRRAHQISEQQLAGRPLWLDGYNVLTTVEAALAGAVVLPGRDGTYRDMASMHGSYRKVLETRPALELIGRTLEQMQIEQCLWFLDRPVSNSGRLKGIMQEVAKEHDWAWTVELVNDPDPLLAEAETVVATADSMILDRCEAWFNLARDVVDRHVAEANVIEIA